ncbi:MAG: hypothetical protein CMC15_13925 [Flavobacteriaceae bacterium]|nr:hypothetical protein [Flavobacteriaceae bacterium]
MGQAKKQQPKKEAKVSSAPFVGLNDQRMSKTRMRIRDQLAETNASLDAEIKAQELALEQGLAVTKMVTMTDTDAENFSEVLVAMKRLWSGVSTLVSKTDTKVIQDLDTAVARIEAMRKMELKAFSPEEKAKAAETLAEDKAALAELLAKVTAAESILL